MVKNGLPLGGLKTTRQIYFTQPLASDSLCLCPSQIILFFTLVLVALETSDLKSQQIYFAQLLVKLNRTEIYRYKVKV